MRRNADRFWAADAASVLLLTILIFGILFAVLSVLRFNLPGDVRLIYSGRVFPGGPWRVIYEQDGRQHSIIAPDRKSAEAVIGKE